MTKRYAVIGDPVSHSLSPVMHAGWIEDHHLDAVYEALLLRSDDPVAAIRALSGFAGVNVTVPHKEAAAKAADRRDDGVANTLRWEADATLSAFNTDGLGFVDSLNESSPGWWEKVETALILGAGGAANGIAHALKKKAARDIELVVANRTRTRAEALAASLSGARVADWNDLEAQFANADLIVQTTTLGMDGTPSPAWPVERCKPGAIVVDIVYRPLQTPLLKAARDRGLTTVDGLGMLIHQGARAFEIWFGVKPDAKKARARLLAALGETP